MKDDRHLPARPVDTRAMSKTCRCDICNREYKFLTPKYSKKKGYEGWRLVCRVCYDRLSEFENKE